MIDVFGDRISINGEELYPVIIDSSYVFSKIFITICVTKSIMVKN